MVDCQKELKTLSEKIMKLMLESLDLSPEDLKWFKPKTVCTEAQNLLQLNSYPGCSDPGRMEEAEDLVRKAISLAIARDNELFQKVANARSAVNISNI